MDVAGTFHRRRERRWIKQHLGEAALIVDGQADDMRVGDPALRRFLHRRNHEIADTAALKLGGMADHGERFGGNSCLKPGGTSRFVLSHGNLTSRSMYVKLPDIASKAIAARKMPQRAASALLGLAESNTRC
jgi:hypothetical protein